MVIIYNDKYVIYTVEKGNLVPSDIFYFSIIDGIIYENFIFVFLTANGFYYHFLNEEISYPCKMYRISEELVNNHIKISKKLKEKHIIYDKKLYPKAIIGIVNNSIITSDGWNEVSIREIDFILFKIIQLIIEKKISEISNLLPIMPKEYIKSLLSILKYYFKNDEAVYRKIFNQEMIEQFELFKYLDFFLFQENEQSERYMKNFLIKNLISQDEKSISQIYNVCNKKELYIHLTQQI
jgi:hypothetical protein